MTEQGKAGRRKTDTKVIEEIMKLYGPLHVTDIVRFGQARGISFKGNKHPTLMARDKMYTSKRFQNFGGNVWGLPWQTEMKDSYALRKELADLEERVTYIKNLLGIGEGE